MQVILALDQGSTNTKALAISHEGDVLAESSIPVEVCYPRPGWVESEPEALWQSVEDAAQACLDQLPQRTSVVAVGVSNQRESAVLWDRTTGAPLGPCVSWRCQRSAEICTDLERDLPAADVLQMTGVPLASFFTAGKFRWLLDHCVAPGREDLCAGTVDSWIAWKLTSGMAFVSDMGNASRTQLFDLSAQNWSPRLLSAFGIPAEILPTVVASSAPLGDCSGLSGCEGAQLASLVGDSHAALFTHFVADPGALKATYGTGTSVLVAASSERPPSNPAGIACSIVWCLDVPRYGLEGNILATGSALDWMTALLGCHDSAALEELAQAANPDSEVSLVPALNGLGAPYWQSGARALISGMTSDSGRAELAHATYEAIAHEVCDVVDAMRDGLQLPPDLLHADGGASRSRLLMQIQADLLGLPVVRSDHAAASARGAAYLAGLAVGFWSIGELGQMEASGEIFTPGEHLSTTMLRRRRWRAAVRQCLLEDGRRLRSGGSGGELGSLMEER